MECHNNSLEASKAADNAQLRVPFHLEFLACPQHANPQTDFGWHVRCGLQPAGLLLRSGSGHPEYSIPD